MLFMLQPFTFEAAFMLVNVCKINSRFNFCYAAQSYAASSPCSKREGGRWWLVGQYVGSNKVYIRYIKVMLHGTIRNDDFYRNTALQCWNNVVTIQNNVATMLQRCVMLKIVVVNRLV